MRNALRGAAERRRQQRRRKHGGANACAHHFDVRMHRPLGISSGVEGIVYFEAPARAALVITKMPSIIGKFFKSSYTLDLSPQTWPAKYTVTSVSQVQASQIRPHGL
jgi:hypothetical protein